MTPPTVLNRPPAGSVSGHAAEGSDVPAEGSTGGLHASGPAGPGAGAHGAGAGRGGETGTLRVLLVGAPNVGKSALFNRLTGAYVAVSNYPGTSVEMARGHARLDGTAVELLDTPGLYSLLPGTEEERVTQRIVLGGSYDVLVHVVDAKNVERMLPLTLQLTETGRPLVVALNMMDEAERLGVGVDHARLAQRLGAEVVPVVAVSGRGLADLGRAILRARSRPAPPTPHYANGVGHAIRDLGGQLSALYPVDATVLASLYLQGDSEVAALLHAAEPEGGARLRATLAATGQELPDPSPYRVAYERQRAADVLTAELVTGLREARTPLRDALGTLLARPLTGLPFLAIVLYFGLYKFVGVFGAGTLVDWVETGLFEARLNPWLEGVFAPVPWEAVRSLFVGEYGMLTLGVRYAVAIVLPVVGTFFLFFSVLEDSGYFPRLALLVDRGFKRIGLSGRAVIPMVLGFACDTMATMVTRTLETRRERVLATLLLALAIPCSAQLGVIIAVLAAHPAALGVWALALVGVFFLVGLISARLMPGAPATFHMECLPCGCRARATCW